MKKLAFFILLSLVTLGVSAQSNLKWNVNAGIGMSNWYGDDTDGTDAKFDKKSVEVSKRLGDVYEQIAAHHGISFLRAADYAHCSGIDEEHLDAEGHSRLAEAVYNKILRDIISEAA